MGVSNERPIIDYFDLMVPPEFIRTIVQFSNSTAPPPNPLFDTNDLCLFFAVMFTMTLQPQNRLEDYWEKGDNYSFKAMDFEGIYNLWAHLPISSFWSSRDFIESYLRPYKIFTNIFQRTDKFDGNSWF